MTDDERHVLDRMFSARRENFAVFKEMAALVGTDGTGFELREPGEKDVTLALIERGLERSPERARELLRQVIVNDKEVVRLTELLIEGKEAER